MSENVNWIYSPMYANLAKLRIDDGEHIVSPLDPLASMQHLGVRMTASVSTQVNPLPGTFSLAYFAPAISFDVAGVLALLKEGMSGNAIDFVGGIQQYGFGGITSFAHKTFVSNVNPYVKMPSVTDGFQSTENSWYIELGGASPASQKRAEIHVSKETNTLGDESIHFSVLATDGISIASTFENTFLTHDGLTSWQRYAGCESPGANYMEDHGYAMLDGQILSSYDSVQIIGTSQPHLPIVMF